MIAAKKLLCLATIVLSLLAPAAAQADFGFAPGSVTMSAVGRDGTPDTQAGHHPFAFNIHFALKTDAGGITEGGAMRDLILELPQGFYGNPQAVPTCPRESFEGTFPQCSPSTQVGVLRAVVIGLGEINGPIYNLASPPGVATELGFSAFGFTVLPDATLQRREDGYGLRVATANVPLESTAATATIWGTPADKDHDPERGSLGGDSSDAPLLPYITLPTNCADRPELTVKADSVLAPGVFVEETATFLDPAGNPAPMSGCESVPFTPGISAAPSSKLAENSSGLDLELKFPNAGLKSPGAVSEATQKKIELVLPEGITANPSAAEGLGSCAESQVDLLSDDPAHCPEASKLGSVEVHTPLLKEPLTGSLYLAKPYENPSNSLIALYLVVQAPERGVRVKLAGKVTPDPKTGQLISVFDDLPQLPYSSFTLHFKEGGRAPLVTPPTCGTYTTVARFTPWSAKDPANPTKAEIRTATSPFTIERGVDGGACPPAGVPPFKPGFEAGSINNAAKAFSPFYMRLIREDGQQDMTRFSSVLPPGVLGKLAGVSKCSQAAINTSKAKSGAQELASSSCPANSQIGRSLAGAGVGSVLTRVPGKVYLAGAFNGKPLSVVAITPIVVGPFDVGTVVVQEALDLNPDTAEVQVDGAASDPIPHIIQGIPAKIRDIRVYVDRSNFILNPTDCAQSKAKATLFGGFLDVFSSADDAPVSLSSRYQAANCASLGFKPKLSIKLNGGTKRGGHPALRAVLNARPADANVGGAVVTLPRSAFLDQAHIRTICTRVQFAAKACPKGAQYGWARAFTPLLDEPIEGPVYLRSSDHKLPDLVAALHSIVDVNVVGRIDSFKGGIRSSFETLPDAPVSKFVLTMQGGKKGLVVNSRDICTGKNRADARFTGQNGVEHDFKPAVKATDCGRARRGRSGAHR